VRKRMWITVISLLTVALLTVGGVTLSKYIATLRDESSTFTASPFYFRSNVLTDDADPAMVTVNGATTALVIANSADSSTHTEQNITYALYYYVFANDEWIKVDALTGGGTLTGGIHSSVTVNAAPVYYDADGDSTPERYDDVMVEAVASAPYRKTLRAKFHFDYTEYTVVHDYDFEMAMVTLKVTTNDDAGVFKIWWNEYLLPDNADPNGILTDAVAGEAYVTPTLTAHTTYRLYFFIKPESLAEVNAQLGSMTPEQQLAMLTSSVTCEKQ